MLDSNRCAHTCTSILVVVIFVKDAQTLHTFLIAYFFSAIFASLTLVFSKIFFAS